MHVGSIPVCNNRTARGNLRDGIRGLGGGEAYRCDMLDEQACYTQRFMKVVKAEEVNQPDSGERAVQTRPTTCPDESASLSPHAPLAPLRTSRSCGRLLSITST